MDTANATQRRAGTTAGGSKLPLEQAYVRYRPLLFSALAKLARQGFAASPHDSLDLIHDFFVEAWGPLTVNYDADKATFETYLYAAFVRFVRPRIVRLHRWTDALVQPAHLAELDTPDIRIAPTETAQRDILAIGRAVAKLTPPEQGLLGAYVSGTATSERELAQRFSLTRYRLRLALADALGKTAVHLGETDALDDAERAVVHALWRDGRTVKETARVLARTTADIQALRMRFFEKLSRAVKGGGPDPTPDPKPDPNPRRKQPMPHPEHLLKAALTSGLHGPELDAVRTHADVIFDFLNTPDADAFFEQHADALTPDALAALYSALGSAEHIDPDDAELLDALLETSEQDERKIGEAFAQVLTPNLPDDLARISDGFFLRAPRVDPERLDQLKRETSVIRGGRIAAELAQFGITPVTVIEASQGIANLARRFCDAHDVKTGGSFILDKAGKTEGYTQLAMPMALAVAEVRMMCELPEATAERLFAWLTRVAEYAPPLFDGFFAELRGDELRLTRTDKSIASMLTRWYTPPQPIAA